MYDAIAKGFNISCGEIIAWINADDFYLPNSFMTVVDVFCEFESVRWITGLPVSYNHLGEITNVNYPWGYSRKNILQGLHGLDQLEYIQQESTFWRREMLNNINIVEFKSFKLAGDYYLWKKFAEFEKLYLIQSCLSGFRKHSDQLSTNMIKYKEEFISILESKISNKKVMYFKLNIFIFKVLKLLPIKIKQRYLPNLIYYSYLKKRWILNE